MEHNLRTRQENEINVLKAIFMKDFIDLREDSSTKNFKRPEFVITLKPQISQHDQNTFSQVDMHIKYSKNYPLRLPKIMIENAKGLSKELVLSLTKDLMELSMSLVKKKEVMILELTLYVQKFLHQHNKPPLVSFYDEMIKNQKLNEEERQKSILYHVQEQKLLEEKKKILIREEVQRKEEVLKTASVEEEFSSYNIPQIDFSNLHNESEDKESKCANDCRTFLCNHLGSSVITFDNKIYRRIQFGKCLGHSSKGANTRLGIDIINGEIVIGCEWDFSVFDHSEFANDEIMKILSKQVSIVEQELQALLRLSHENLVPYFGSKYLIDEGKAKFFVLQQYICGIPLSWHLDKNITATVNQVQFYSQNILKALTYLHSHNIIHRSLRCSSILIDNKGLIKLTDYCIEKRLSDTYNIVLKKEISADSLCIGRSAKKIDVYKFGLVVLSIFTGVHNEHIFTSIPKNISGDFLDFLNCCLIKDEKSRWSAEELLHHIFVKNLPLTQKEIPALLTKEFDIELGNETFVSPYPSNRNATKSRLHNEFEILKFLGRGNFGEVIKVQNRLDGGIYAVKRIVLDHHNKLFNKKIMREVKLLSQLNHENIVRYYNSWIESSNTFPFKENDKIMNENSNVESITNASFKVSSSDWNFKYIDNPDDSQCLSEENLYKEIDLSNGSSVSIVFEDSDLCEKNTMQRDMNIENEYMDKKDDNFKNLQIMYIQMEFCGKKTLKTAIDNNLYLEKERLWRFFREIVEGLAHIHQQGMIHRDIKPTNIFIDMDDHIKIGDFGLATVSIVKSQFCHDYNLTASKIFDVYNVDETQTSQVGTILYVAPEVLNGVEYSQVDIYSLGVTLFEMCYPPLNTFMEKVKVICDLRMPEIIFPIDSTQILCNKQLTLIKWLMTHDPLKRPSAVGLLHSDFLPLQFEDAKVHEIIRHAISNTQTKIYKYLISSCFNQKTDSVQDIAFDMDMHTYAPLIPNLLISHACEKIACHVFQRHGAISFSPSLLLPFIQIEENNNAVKLMDHGGTLVMLPQDMHTPLARFIARKGLNNLRRYYFGKIYHERKVFGFHPCESSVCAFDIITKTHANLMPDSEIIVVVFEIIKDIPSLYKQQYLLCINHATLLQIIFECCHIKEEKQSLVYTILQAKRYKNWSWLMCESYLNNLQLSGHVLKLLKMFVECEGSLCKVSSLFNSVLKKKVKDANLVKAALQDIEIVIKQAEWMGLSVSYIIVPTMALNRKKNNGIVFEYVIEPKKYSAHLDILAAGGRYDLLVKQFRNNFTSWLDDREVTICATGVTIFVDKMLHVIKKEDNMMFTEILPLEAVICSLDQNQMLKEKAQLARYLWACDIHSQIIYDPIDNLEHIQTLYRRRGVSHFLIMKEYENGLIRMKSWDKDKCFERKIPFSDVCEYFLRARPRGEVAEFQKNDTSRFTQSENVILGYTFFTMGKLTPVARRRCESQIYPLITNVLMNFAHKVHIEVFVLDVSFSIIQSLSSYLDFENYDIFHKSISVVLDKHSRYRKYLSKICDEMYILFCEKKISVFILFSLSENKFKVIL